MVWTGGAYRKLGKKAFGGMDHSSYLLGQLLIFELNQAKNGCSSLRAVIDSGMRPFPFRDGLPLSLLFPKRLAHVHEGRSPLRGLVIIWKNHSVRRGISYQVALQHTQPEFYPNSASTWPFTPPKSQYHVKLLSRQVVQELIASNSWGFTNVPWLESKRDVAAHSRPNSRAFDGIHVVARRENLQARKIVELYARSSFDSLKLWPPKSYFFSPSGHCVIAYAVANNIAVSLGDPVGAEAEIEVTARKFLKACKEKGWDVAFYKTCTDFLPIYRRLRLRKLKIGDDVIVDLPEFSLAGRSKRDIRSKARRFEQLDIRVVEYRPRSRPTLSHNWKTLRSNG